MRDPVLRSSRLLAAVVPIVMLIIVACGGSTKPSDAIVGTWQRVESETTYTFQDDGTLTLIGGSRSGQGTYEFLNDTRLRLNIEGGGFRSRTVDVEISGDQMKFDDQGNTEDFQRLK